MASQVTKKQIMSKNINMHKEARLERSMKLRLLSTLAKMETPKGVRA